MRWICVQVNRVGGRAAAISPVGMTGVVLVWLRLSGNCEVVIVEILGTLRQKGPRITSALEVRVGF